MYQTERMIIEWLQVLDTNWDEGDKPTQVSLFLTSVVDLIK